MSIGYKYYSLKNILSKNAQYNIIFGERSNGKTYAVEYYGLENYIKTHETMGLIRRWKEDFRGKRGQHMFDALVANNVPSKLTKGEFNTIVYRNYQWFLAKYDSETNEYTLDIQPFCYAFTLSDVEHDKSVSFPTITTILFDEFLTRGLYLQDEFVIFMNVLSTIIRQRDNVKIFMLGNTVNKFCPYFNEMGLGHIRDMKQGTIDLYTYGDSKLVVAVEYCGNKANQGKKSDVYFAFDSPKLSMIKGGSWELDIYPHLPIKYKPKEVVFNFFIVFDAQIVQCEVINTDNSLFVFCHLKTSELEYRDSDIIYQLDSSNKFNIRYSFCTPIDNIDKKILKLYVGKKFFYQSNDVGEIVRNFIRTTGGR